MRRSYRNIIVCTFNEEKEEINAMDKCGVRMIQHSFQENMIKCILALICQRIIKLCRLLITSMESTLIYRLSDGKR